MLLNPDRIRASLRRLHSARPDVFGANEHRFLLNPPIPEAQAAAFESEHSVQLPAEYRHFLTAIGNGGAGPFYGVFPFGMMDAGFGQASWIDHQGIVGKLSDPFAPPQKLNGKSRGPAKPRSDGIAAVLLDSSPLDGAIPICHIGCALRIWLVIAGEKEGHLWYDGRAEQSGLSPLRNSDGSPTTFAMWYEDWLIACLRDARLN
jgi:hypothetical protein